MSTSNVTLRTLQRVAVVGAVVVGGALVWDHISNRDPNTAAHQAASDAFAAGDWARAHTLFSDLVSATPGSLAAQRGRANSLVQLKRFDEAHAVMSSVVQAEPTNACNYATRGIISDNLNRFRDAMRDYARAVKGCRVAVHGMGWLDRLMSNIHERPPTVAERLSYLRVQMELPESERVMRLPQQDRTQKPWTS